MTTPNPATDAVVPADAEFVQNWRYMTSSNDNSNAYITRRGLARLIARIDAELTENAKLREALDMAVIARFDELAKLRAALQAVVIDSIECPEATSQYFITSWAMDKVREAIKEPKTCDFGVAHPFENDPVHGQDCACLDDDKPTHEALKPKGDMK